MHFALFRWWKESGLEILRDHVGVYFALKCLQSFYDPTTDKEAYDFVCVLAKAREPCR